MKEEVRKEKNGKRKTQLKFQVKELEQLSGQFFDEG